jgi:hypothetical protein
MNGQQNTKKSSHHRLYENVLHYTFLLYKNMYILMCACLETLNKEQIRATTYSRVYRLETLTEAELHMMVLLQDTLAG